MTSCILSAVRLHFSTTHSSLNQPHTLTLYLTFLRRTSTGPATVTIHDSKLGRRTSTIHVSLTQGTDKREEVVGYITNSNISTESGLTLPTNWSLHPAPFPADIAKLRSDNDELWKLQDQIPFAAFRKASQYLKFWLPRKIQLERSLIDEWICFANGERFTMDSLGFVVDMWPQVAEQFRPEEDGNSSAADANLGMAPSGEDKVGAVEAKLKKNKWARFWYPTLLLNLEVKKALPPEGVEWLFVRVRAKQMQNGRADLEVVVLDEYGDIVALSQHVQLILSAERNMAPRKGNL